MDMYSDSAAVARKGWQPSPLPVLPGADAARLSTGASWKLASFGWQLSRPRIVLQVALRFPTLVGLNLSSWMPSSCNCVGCFASRP